MKQCSSPVFLAIAFIAILFSACIRDKCGNVHCDNSGVCVGGICSCPTGYEGSACEKKWYDKFSGNWNADDVYYKDAAHHLYTIDIKGKGTDSLVIDHFADSLQVLCSRTKLYSFNFVANQKLNDSFTITSGNGIMDSLTGKVKGSYSVQLRRNARDTNIVTNFSWTR